MPIWNLSRPFLTSVVPVCALLGVLGTVPALAQDRDERRVRHDVKQANLYLKMKLPTRARELLTKTVAEEPGRSNPLAWLALGQAYYYERRIDDAGQAVERARSLGVEQASQKGKRKWAKRFLARYMKNIGALVVDGGACEDLQFDAQLAAPMMNKTRKALLDSVPGWRSGTLQRTRGEKFFLPAGRYRFGQVKVKVLAGEMARMAAEEVGARCPGAPALAVGAPGAPLPGGAMSAQAAPEQKSWFASNWGWVVVGAVVVAGSATAIGLATSGGPDQLSFDGNPSSFRAN